MSEYLRAPVELHTAAQCRELDRLAIERQGIDGFVLMQRAGRAAFETVLQRWPAARRLVIYCGRGNNAGDGYVIAGLARELGLSVQVLQLGDPADLRGDAAQAREWARDRGVTAEDLGRAPAIAEADVVVDALLGTGLRGSLSGAFAAAAKRINACGCPVLAVDIPTGVDADTGAADPCAVKATVTVSFIGRKLGLHTGPGVSFRGDLVHHDLGVHATIHRAVAGLPWWRYGDLPAWCRLPARDANVHKHALGHLVVIGGDYAMGGAVLLAAEAALRCGAGMVSVLTRTDHRPALLARRPELMVADAADPAARADLLARSDCLVVGPGLGRADWGLALLNEALARGLPSVVDADGLTLMARDGIVPEGPVVITPHPGEAARLLATGGAEIQADRPAAALALAERCGGVAVLKGAGTMLARGPAMPAHGLGGGGAGAHLLGVCAHGNPGMASAGMGDVLSGIIAGLLAQGLDPAGAALAGACLHGLAGDRAAARIGVRSLLAGDVIEAMVGILAAETAAA
jgi:ADP-dependent NAD(P)H-hydrate dehydratase / NAD(P)H-hydrate epimerase